MITTQNSTWKLCSYLEQTAAYRLYPFWKKITSRIKHNTKCFLVCFCASAMNTICFTNTFYEIWLICRYLALLIIFDIYWSFDPSFIAFAITSKNVKKWEIVIRERSQHYWRFLLCWLNCRSSLSGQSCFLKVAIYL